MFGRNGKNICWSIKKSDDILYKIKSKGFLASSLSIYDFSTLNNTPSHNPIKEKLTELIEQYLTGWTHFIWLVMRNAHFSFQYNLKYIFCGHVRKFYNALLYLLDNIFIRYGLKLYIDKL